MRRTPASSPWSALEWIPQAIRLPRSRLFLPAFAALLFAALLSGCAHYRLGTQGQLGFQRLYIEPVTNDAGLPQATALVSTQLRETFLRDGRLTLVADPAQAEATLSVSLAHYDRGVATFRPDDTGLARKFDLTLHALCTLRDNRSGKKLFENRPVYTTRQAFTTATPESRSSDQLQSEYNTLPLLASSLGDRIAHTVLDVW